MCVLVPQSCLTLFNSMDWSPPGSSVRGILQARILEWVCHFLLQGIFPTQSDSLPSELPGKPETHFGYTETFYEIELNNQFLTKN